MCYSESISTPGELKNIRCFDINVVMISREASPTFGHANCKFFSVYIPYKESISKEMNNDNDLNLHSMTKFRVGFATGHDFCSTLVLVKTPRFDSYCGQVYRPARPVWV